MSEPTPTQDIQARGANRSHRPTSAAFRAFMAGQWADPTALPGTFDRMAWADATAERRDKLAAQFPGERLVIPAGSYKTRTNDTDYRFRPHSAFAHLTGLGTDQEPDAVLVLHPLSAPDDVAGGLADGPGADATVATFADAGIATGADTAVTNARVAADADAAAPGIATGADAAVANAGVAALPVAGDVSTNPFSSPSVQSYEAVLYMRPASGKDSPEFYADSRYGEFWVGRRPTLAEIATQTGLRTEHIDALADALAKDAGPGHIQLRVIAEADAQVSQLVDQVRQQAGFPIPAPQPGDLTDDEKLSEAASELRLIKDAWEIDQVRAAIAGTIAGFERVVRALPKAAGQARGERVVEASFENGARIAGNGVGYETIAAAGPHATTLHWVRNDGPVPPDGLLLLDAGIEVDSLYTADITRTVPVCGTYTPVQRRVYQAVVDAADAAFAIVRPGVRFREIHEAAMRVIAERLEAWGLLPVSAAEALSPEGQQHRRWMVHGTSHHLGIDVHDCAQARKELYIDGILAPGMIFTIEPGLYFKLEDLAVPAEYRGIGARCEDDILVTADGAENLSAALPRHPDQIETWMAGIWAVS